MLLLMETVVFKEIASLGLLVKKVTDFKDKTKNVAVTMSEVVLLNITVFHSWRKMTVMDC